MRKRTWGDDRVFSAEFTPDGRRVVNAGNDRTVRAWDLAAGGEPTVLRGHDNNVKSAAFSPDGRGGGERRHPVRVWDCEACGSLQSMVALVRAQRADT